MFYAATTLIGIDGSGAAFAQEGAVPQKYGRYFVEDILDTIALRSSRYPEASGTLNKWQSPVIAVPSVDATFPRSENIGYIAAIQRSFARLAKITGQDLTLQPMAKANYVISIYEDVYVLPRERVARLFESMFVEDRSYNDFIDAAQKSNVGCFDNVYVGQDGVVHGAMLFVSLKQINGSVERCLNYLTARSLGVFGRPPQGIASIFNYFSGNIEDLTDFDIAVLEFLYRDDLKSGTRRDEIPATLQ